MKNARIQPLVVITCIFVMLVAGLFCSRNQARTPVQVQRISPPVSMETTAETGTGPESTICNINTATAEELQALPGIGTVLAGRIVAYRTEHGPFESVGALMLVDGIGEAKLEAIWDLVTTGG